MKPSLILPHLYLGDRESWRDVPHAAVLSVLEVEKPPANHMWCPLLVKDHTEDSHPHGRTVNPAELKRALRLISAFQSTHTPLLVHCGAGVERSPLTIVCYIRMTTGVSIEEAYDYVSRLRPIVADRRPWLPWISSSEQFDPLTLAHT